MHNDAIHWVAAYATGTLSACKAIGARLKAASLLLDPNMTGTWGQFPTWNDQFLAADGVTGGLDEFFVLWPGFAYQPQKYIDNAMNSQQQAETQGKVYLAQSISSGEAQATFGLAVALLTANGHVGFSAPHDNGYSSDEAWYPEFDVAKTLGRPKGAKYASGALSRRDFANGYVTVDFANHVGVIHGP